MHHHIFALFLQIVYAIEKLLAGFIVQPRIDMMTALSWDASDDVLWVHTASSIFLHSQLKLLIIFCD